MCLFRELGIIICGIKAKMFVLVCMSVSRDVFEEYILCKVESAP